MIIKEEEIRKIIKEEILLEQTISELIAKVPKKAVVKVMKKAFKSPKVALKLGKFYIDGENWNSLVQFMGEKLKGEADKFDSEDAVLDYINDNADKLVGFATEHYNQAHPDDEPIKLEVKKSEIKRIINEELSLQEKKKKGLWANIHAKKKRGEKSNPRSKAYQDAKKAGQRINKSKKEIDENEDVDESSCSKNEDVDESSCSEGLLYHIKSKRGLDENIFRPGSKAFFSLFREARDNFKSGKYTPVNDIEAEMLRDTNIGEYGMYEGIRVPLDFPVPISLDEAKYKGREVTLGKKGATRTGGGRGRVYVKNDKGNVVKVEFGSPMADAMGDSKEDKKRRKNYGDRHNCADKKDKTKPGYWSCRATKLFGRDIPGWW